MKSLIFVAAIFSNIYYISIRKRNGKTALKNEINENNLKMLKRHNKIIKLILILTGIIFLTNCQNKISDSFCLIYEQPNFKKEELKNVSLENLVTLNNNNDNYEDICN